ncbi:cupin [Acinetobacter boissieri]|uniref:Mannose-6-phosphate isomerase, cupin superfamily n=1 Tax=Acinetobacter boissieri TaxID=1219383 RepID=A0A1G6JNW2_9GAMM|nr:cupin [Acinetobacter boissieri]SDC20442.1 Mannose-6-phosphate isomerase, cupin superfamily [Acinetobacter boissieri]
MKIINSKKFTGNKAWDALDITKFNTTTIRLHWTDQPYIWHVNDGEEVFAVVDGIVNMYYKEDGLTKNVLLNVGDIFFASIGTEHVAHPQGEARILVIEQEGSI